MRIAIIYFSATGNTDRVARWIADHLGKQGATCQVRNIARDPLLFPEPDVDAFARERVDPHDLLCVGSPVYVHHMRHDMCSLLAALPRPGGKWGGLAAAFVTYGGINSGVALEEAGASLARSGRTVVAGLKVNGEHSVTRMPQMRTKINAGLPYHEAWPAISVFAQRLAAAVAERPSRKSLSLRYQSFWQRVKDRSVFREKAWQRHGFPEVVIDRQRCSRCGRCVKACPIRRLRLYRHGAGIAHKRLVCAHCGNCQLACNQGALELRGNWRFLDNGLAQGAAGRGPIASAEPIVTKAFVS